jgi:ribonuclease T1
MSLVRRALAAALVLVAALPLAACGPAAPAWDASAGGARGADARAARSADRDPLAAVSEGERAEVRDELRRIAAGGPFLHRRDGIAFANREGRLPPEPAGYYREYTVETPGAPDRGARRLVVGRRGEVFYSHDHYQSFVALGRAPGAAR